MENSTVRRDQDLDRIAEQRSKLKVRHATALTRLMDQRADLRGTYAFADLLEEHVRWSA